MNIPHIRDSAQKLKGYKGLIETNERPPLDYLSRLVENERILIQLINYDLFIRRINNFNGHYIIITGFENGNVIYDDNGPKGAGQNKQASTERFEQARDLCPFDWGLIVV